ncbi:MAG: TlpA family protein disulfide reductase [Candidatus Eremiobacteraeota bacterium]|nr:TlpA family protein disulfide reductase [Candidatus Eremiobacteraeota bacterium]
MHAIHFNQRPPDFTFPTGSGNERLSALVGTPVVINFWATWCHACVDEMPLFERLTPAYGKLIAVITVSNEAAGVAQTFLVQRGLGLPLLEDPAGAIFSAYSVENYPVTVVVDSRGEVSYVSVGGLDWSELSGAVDKALATK